MTDQLSLVQRSFFLPGLTIETTTDGKLMLQSKGLLRSWSRTYSLDEIDPAPIHERTFAAGWAIGATAATAIVGFGIWEAIPKGWPDVGSAFFLGFLGLIAFALVLNAIRLSPNLYAYRSSRAHVLLFSIRRGQPSPEAVDAFVSSLAQRIAAYRAPRGLSPAQLTEHFGKALAYLLENEVLSREEYTAAAKRLEEKHSSKVVLEFVKK
jgi:hypothetical protein